MLKRTILGIVSFSIFAFNATAQTVSNTDTQYDTNGVNAFTFGSASTHSAEDNFRNLFRTVPKLIDNPDSLKFLNYKFITTLQNKKEAIHYFLKNLHENAPMVYYYTIGDSTYIALSKLQGFNRTESIKALKQWIEQKDIQAGYKVYQINFILNRKKIHHYVFINPKTNQVVVTKFTFFGAILQPIK